MLKCKICGSRNIEIWDCGYSSFNPGGGKCRYCGFTVKGEAGCDPSRKELIAIWDKGQTLTDGEKLKYERGKARRLRKQLRGAGLVPVA